MLVCYVVDGYILKIQIQTYLDLDHPAHAGALRDETSSDSDHYSRSANITPADSHRLKSSSNVCR